MRTKVLLLASMLLVCFNLSAQKVKIAKDEVDKFSGNHITETKLEQLCFKNTNLGTAWHSVFLLLRKTNDIYTIPANIYLPDIEKYVEDSGITFLTSEGNTVILNTLYTGVSSRDKLHDNSCVFSTAFELSSDDVRVLSSEKITDIRIRYLGSSFDMEIPDKKQDLIIRMFQAVDETSGKK